MEETREHLSIFLEYVPGGSIGRIVRTHGKVSPREIVAARVALICFDCSSRKTSSSTSRLRFSKVWSICTRSAFFTAT